MAGSGAKAAASMYEDRVFFRDISESTGSEKVRLISVLCYSWPARHHNSALSCIQAEFFNTRFTVSMIKPDQHMYYNACQKCNRKVTEDQSSGFWCESCGQKLDSCNKRQAFSWITLL